MTTFGHENIAWRDIAMRDAFGVGFLQCVGDLDSVLKRLVKRHCAASQPIRERLALQVLHHEVRGAVLFAHVIEGADVRMIELADRPRLAVESLTEVPVVSEPGRQDFDRHGPIEAGVASVVDLAHAAAAEHPLDDIRTKPRPRVHRAGGDDVAEQCWRDQ